jgi:hypothetical protein
MQGCRDCQGATAAGMIPSANLSCAEANVDSRFLQTNTLKAPDFSDLYLQS